MACCALGNARTALFCISVDDRVSFIMTTICWLNYKINKIIDKSFTYNRFFRYLMTLRTFNLDRCLHNFIVKFRKIYDICNIFAENRTNNHENVSCCSAVLTFSDLEAIPFPIQQKHSVMTARIISLNMKPKLLKTTFSNPSKENPQH